MSGTAVSIDDLISENTNKESPSPILPNIKYRSNYILIDSKHFEQPEKKVIIYTGLVLSRTPNRTDKLYKLTETLDDGYIEIYTKTDETLEKGIRCKILQDNGYDTQSSGCNMSGGKRRKRRTKKNKKRKSKKCKSKRRMRK
jgi:hypothetical protein